MITYFSRDQDKEHEEQQIILSTSTDSEEGHTTETHNIDTFADTNLPDEELSIDLSFINKSLKISSSSLAQVTVTSGSASINT